MATLTLLLSIILVSSSTFFSSASLDSSAGINQWCDQTPYPETCKHFLSQHGSYPFTPKEKSNFRKLAIQIAMQRAVNAEAHTKTLGPKCRNEREKAAWADCVSLYESTILQLNKTIDPNTKCTDFDAQTWLSTALTNLETCRQGFIELGVSDFMLPLMANNVSELICNTLSLGNGSIEKKTYNGSFPSWVSPNDRKLLQAATPTPNLVVAQDGSGNVRTIQAAFDA